MTAAKPPMTWIGTNGNNIWQGVGLTRKTCVVLHIMQGTLAGCDSWFKNAQAQASANYGIGKNGAIHCYVDPQSLDAPYANGLVNAPDATFLTLQAEFPGVNPNLWSISLEHEGMSGEALTPAQLAASADLTAWLCQTFAIPPTEDHLLGHYEIDSVTRAGCPGWDRAGWVRYVNAVTAAGAGEPVPPVKPQMTNDSYTQANRILLANGTLNPEEAVVYLQQFRNG